ncbi:SDR family NAD(P)-dependent oxidoreductase [Kineococcus xinjiangensis]|uniref:SDR family NAD(P)-dependent oxidoreductase n=1 Tax=Kineococcus xinjiangensis TaxID=512762 RepID=UPI000CEC6DD1
MAPYAFAGGTAVVTGAAGGIGTALATQLARRGSSVVLLDRDAAGLQRLAGRLRSEHPAAGVHTHVVDLADRAAIDACAEEVLAAQPRLTLLVNNAGIGLGGMFDQVDLEQFWLVMDVNFRATVQLTHRLLPALRAAPGSHLVNVSSLFGLIAPPGQTAYAASKFAVRGFTEALRSELAPHGVGVTCVHPGGIRTDIARNSLVGSGVPADEARAGREDFEKFLTIPAEVAATEILRAVERRNPRLLIGTSAKVPDLLARVLPGRYPSLLRSVERLAAHSGRRR